MATILSRRWRLGDFVGLGIGFRLASVGVLIGFYVSTTVTNLYQERAALEEQILHLSEVTAVSAEIHSRSIFESTAHGLKAVRAALTSPSDRRQVDQVLQDNFFNPPHLWALLYLDDRGWVTHATAQIAVGNRRARDPEIEPAQFPFFRAHSQRDIDRDAVYTGDLVVGSTTNAPHLLSSIGVYDSGGVFEGVVAAAYELTYFRDVYARLVPSAAYTIALWDEQGGLIIASNSRIDQGGQPSSPKLQNANGREGEIGNGFHRDYRKVTGFPFRLEVLANRRLLFAEQKREERFKILLTVMFVLTVTALSLALEAFVHTRRRALRDKLALEEQLRQSQKMEALGTLAGGLAHDFNNMLSAIIGFGEMVRDAVSPGTRVRWHVEQVLLAGRRAEALVDHILTFSRQTETASQPMLLNAAVGEAVELIRLSAAPTVQLTVTQAKEPFWIEGDLPQIVQMLLNLANNALQAMPAGGRLTVALDGVTLSADEAIHKMGLSAGPHARLQVLDTGEGIPPAVRDRIFEPFFTTKERGKGTGLGLSIVHGIVTAHKGWIGVDSAADKGTSVTVLIPIGPPAAGTAQPDPAPSLEGSGRAVLFIDDDDSIVTLAEEYLANQGFEPLGFTTGAEALALFDEDPSRIDLVISDCAMPHPDGLAVARHVRAARPDLPIILITGEDPIVMGERVRGLGVSEVVRKPLRQRRLATSIHRALGDRVLKRSTNQPG